MAAILQTTLSIAFSWMKMLEFRLKFHWSLFLGVQLTTSHHWLRWWLGAIKATSHYLNQWWFSHWCIYASLGLNELNVWIILIIKFNFRSQVHYELNDTRIELMQAIFLKHFIYDSMLFYGILWYHDKCSYTIIVLLNVAEMIYCIILCKSTIAKSLINHFNLHHCQNIFKPMTTNSNIKVQLLKYSDMQLYIKSDFKDHLIAWLAFKPQKKINATFMVVKCWHEYISRYISYHPINVLVRDIMSYHSYATLILWNETIWILTK